MAREKSLAFCLLERILNMLKSAFVFFLRFFGIAGEASEWKVSENSIPTTLPCRTGFDTILFVNDLTNEFRDEVIYLIDVSEIVKTENVVTVKYESGIKKMFVSKDNYQANLLWKDLTGRLLKYRKNKE
jgi:hypothetical protein